jgi:gliding motility-associated-like protein
MIRALLFLVFNTILISNIYSSHLVGGNLAYEFVGVQPNGDFRYKLKLNYYFDCGSASNWQPPNIPQNMSVGVYAHDDPTDIYPTTSGSYPKYGGTDVDMVYNSAVQQYFEVTPNNPSGCTVGTSTCVYTVLYIGQIDLAPVNPSTGQPVIGGYFLIHEACCRNGGGNGIDNIQSPGSAGMAFYSYIPPYGYENNSPIFTDNPVPFICAGDTTTFLNTAIDPDGDELLFSFTAPLDGNHAGGFGGGANNVGNGGAGPGGSLTWYPTNYPWPIEEVSYAGGYSYQQPFGPTGYYYISASNGLTKYKSNNQGKFVVGLIIKEYRDGTLIGISTREVQLNIIACPPNDAPSLTQNINPQGGFDSTEYFIEEGENLCFDIAFIDPDVPADSLTLNVNGQIFDSLFTNPPATVGGYFDTIYSDPLNGIDTAKTTFCWDTDCGQAQNLPYILSASVSDRGCPPKTTSIVYEVTVSKTNPPANIYGSVIECQNAETVYTTDDNPNISGYTWDVSAGGIITQDYGDSVKVFWSAPGTGTVFLKAINQYGCESDPISMNTTITPAPTVDAGSDVNICQGDSVLLSGTTTSLPGYISLWQPNTNVSSPSNMSTWVSPTVTTSYYLLVQRGTSCVGGDSITVTVDVGNIDAGIDNTICLGDSVQLNATGNGSNFVWTPTNNISQTNIQNPTVWPDITTIYNVQFTSSNNCTAEDSVVVFVNPVPGTSPNFILNGSANALANNTYQMTSQVNNDFASIWNSSMLNLNQPFQVDAELNFGTQDATGADGMAFVLQRTSTNYAPSLGNADFAIIDPSLIVEFDTWNNQIYNDINDDHIAILKDGSSDHNINSLLSPVSLGNIEDGAWHTISINWDPLSQNFTVNFDGVQVANLNYDIVQNIFSNNPAVYWGFTATTGGSNNNQSIRFTNTSAFSPINDLVICESDTVTINSPVITDNYLWEPNVDVSNNTAESPEFSPLVTSNYFFTGTNSFGCSVKDTFQLTVNNLPLVSAGTDQDVCIGDSITLNSSGNAASFTWDNSVIDGQIFEVNNTVNYILTGTSLDGCINTDTVLITALASPSTDAGNDINLCVNDSIQLQASGADNYLWSPNTFLSASNISNPWVIPTTNTTYILTGSLTNGCTKNDTINVAVNPLPVLTTSNDAVICEGDTIQISVFGGNTFNWISANNISNSSISNPQVWPTSTTTYKVLASDINTCADTAEITITVNPKPSVNAGVDQNICFGDSTSLNASGNANSFSWNNGIINGGLFEAVLTQDYILTGIDLNNCSNQDTVTVNTLNLPIIDAGQDETICIGDSIQLFVTGGDNYFWTPNVNINNNVVSDPIVYPSNLTQYVVTGTDINNCSNKDTINVNVNQLPTLSTSNDAVICDGDTIQIQAFGGTVYNWLTTDSINNTGISSPLVWPSATTLYSVLVSDANTCKDTAEVLITVNPKPVVNAGLDQDICFGDSTLLNASGSAINYSWDNGILNSILFEVTSSIDYIVVGTDVNNCSNNDTVTVNVLALPAVNAGQDVVICTGDSIQVSASGANNYSWSPNTNISNNGISSPFIYPTVLTDYIVTGTDLNNCSNTDTLKVEINQLPNITISNDTSICVGDSIFIAANGGVTYSWLNTDFISNVNTANPEIWPSTTTTYSVIVTDNNNCSDTSEVNILVNNLPNVNAGNDQDLCIGDTAQIIVSGAVNYQWSPNINISSTISNSIDAWPSNTTNYVVTAVDANFCFNTDTIKINILALPQADAGSDLWICPGGTASLNAVGGNQYSWEPDSTLNVSNIANPLANPIDDETYVVTVIDTNNCVNYDTLFLKVNRIVPTDAGGDTLKICGSSIVNLGGNPTAPIGSTYQWRSNETILGPTTANPTSQPLTPNWFIVETANDTCTGIDSVFVDFFGDVIGSSSNDTSICFGESTTLLSSGGSSYSWTPITNQVGDTILINDSSSSPTVAPLNTTTFTVSIFDTNGCSIVDSTTIIIKPLPTFDLGIDLSYCINDSVSLSAPTDQNYNYLWSPNYAITNTTIFNPLVFSQLDTMYTLALTDTLSCTNYDSIRVTINSLPSISLNSSLDSICLGDSSDLSCSATNLTYDWTPNTNITNVNVFDPTVFPNSSIYYFLAATDGNGCTSTDSIFITVLDLPIANAGNDTAACPGIPMQLNGSGGIVPVWINANTLTNPNIYNPIAAPSVLTNYTLKVTDNFGCVGYDTVLVDVFNNAVANAGSDIDTCANVPVILQASGGLSYLWYDSLYLNHNDVANPIAFPDNDMSFIVEVTDSNGCLDTDTMNVFIFLANVSSDTIICKGNNFQANIFGDNPNSVSWSPTNGVSDPSTLNPVIAPEETTTYLVSIDDGNGCIIVDTLVVQIPEIEAIFDTLINPGCNGIEVLYTNTSDPELNFSWLFSDNESSLNNEVLKTFQFGSDFSGTLFIEDTNGCIESNTYGGSALTFDDYFTITDPNVFTPNGDGENDEFIIQIPEKVQPCSELSIYNRWGQIQYFSTGFNLKWDGRNNVGSEAPSGTYFYTLNIKDKSFKGALNLIRK